MLPITILITGGLVVAGARFLRRRKEVRTPVWLIQADGSRVKSYAVVIEDAATTERALEQEINTTYTLSTVSFGLNLLSELIFAPLRWLDLLVDIYFLGLMIEESYDERFVAQRGARLVVLGALVLNYMLMSEFLLISFTIWGYFFYRKVAFDFQKRLGQTAAAPA